MADYQQNIDDIRFKLQSDYCELSDELRRLAADYAATCSDVNSRLRRCGEYLKQGLRSEAINLAEADPNLLDLVALVDFPEREQWDELLGMYEIPKADPLLLHVAESLNESYAAEQPLQKLLERHRRLALSRAPLKRRLVVIRQLRDLDPTSHFWEDDVNEYEHSRLQEVAGEAEAASAQRDAKALTELVSELQESDWQQTPSPSLVKKVRKYAARLKRTGARDELQDLAVELNDAFSALDFAHARGLREQWNTAAIRAKLAPDDPLCEQVSPVLGWLEDEDARELADKEYHRAVAALERALDRTGGSPEALERLGHNVRKFEREMPETLAIRYRNQLEGLQLAESRHRKLIIGSSATMLLLVVLIMVVVIRSNLRATEWKRIAQTVESQIDKGQLAESRKLLDAHEDMSTSEWWLAANQKLAQAERKEQSRQSEFRMSLESAQAADNYESAMIDLKRATEVAATSDEKLLVARLDREWEQRHQQQKSAGETEFRNQISQVSRDIQRLETMVSNFQADEQFDDLLAHARSGIRSLTVKSASVSPQLVSQANLLGSRLADLQKAHVQTTAKAKLFQRLTDISLIDPYKPNAAQRIESYGVALKDFAENFADDARATAFRQSADEVDAWKGAIAYMRLEHVVGDFVPQTNQIAKKRIEECNNYLTVHEKSPYAKVVREYIAYLEAIHRRAEGPDGDSDEGVNSKVFQLFSGPLMDDVHILKSKKGEVFYLPKEVGFSGKTQASFQFMVGFDGKTAGKALLVDQLLSNRSAPAPHSAIAESVRKREWIGKIVQWESYFQKLTSTIRSDDDLDPFLKYLLLLRTLEYAAEGSQPLATALSEEIAELQRAKVDLTVRWMDPGNEDVAASRKAAGRVINKLGELTSAWKESGGIQQRLQQRTLETTIAIGWLSRQSDGVWTCHTQWKPTGNFELKIVGPVGSGSHTWQRVGRADADLLTISATDKSMLREGRLVFAFKQTKPQVVGSKSQQPGVPK